MQSAEDLAKEVLHDVPTFIELFERGWTYPERPLIQNEFTTYRLLRATNPSLFYIEIDDKYTWDIRDKVAEARKKYKGLIEAFGFNPLPIEVLRECLPVVVCGKEKVYWRGEVNATDPEKERVNVTLVDSGEEVWVSKKDIYPPSTDLLRFPKLALRCTMAQLVPYGQPDWPPNDYFSILQGKATSLVFPVGCDRGVIEVYLECDGKDVGLQLIFILGIGDLVPLEKVLDTSVFHVGKYPKLNYEYWIGCYIPIYGVKVINSAEAVLHMNPQAVNDIVESIEARFSGTVKDPSEKFPKEIGDPCIVEFKVNEFYRATIIRQTDPGMFLVKLVDYWDFALVAEAQLRKIPAEWVEIAEGATMCVLAEFFNLSEEKLEEMEPKMREIIEYQDLFCRIGSTDFRILENQPKRPVVSISQPVGEDGAATPLWKLMEVPGPEICTWVMDFKLTTFISNEVGDRLFDGPTDYIPEKQYRAILTCAENEKVVYLHLEDDGEKAEAFAEEMTKFYNAWEDCPELTAGKAVPGTYVVAKQEGDDNWYRGKILKARPDMDKYQVLFLDYGNWEVVSLTKMKGLVSYFGREKKLALQVSLPVVLSPNPDMNEFSDRVLELCDGVELQVMLEYRNNQNYAWIIYQGISLAHTLVQEEFATRLLFTPAANITAMIGIPN